MTTTTSLDPDSWLLTPASSASHVWFAGAPVAQLTHSVPSEPRAATEVVWTVTDHLGTPRVQTDTTGAIVWYAEHEPYGEVHLMRAGAQRHQPLRFPGQEAEQLGAGVGPNGVSSRSYNIFRWYRPGAGRYTQADPLGLGDSLNLHGYVEGNPLRYLDRHGLLKGPDGSCSSADCSCLSKIKEGIDQFNKLFPPGWPSQKPKCYKKLKEKSKVLSINYDDENHTTLTCFTSYAKKMYVKCNQSTDPNKAGGPLGNYQLKPTYAVWLTVPQVCDAINAPVLSTIIHEVAHNCGAPPDKYLGAPQDAKEIEKACAP